MGILDELDELDELVQRGITVHPRGREALTTADRSGLCATCHRNRIRAMCFQAKETGAAHRLVRRYGVTHWSGRGSNGWAASMADGVPSLVGVNVVHARCRCACSTLILSGATAPGLVIEGSLWGLWAGASRTRFVGYRAGAACSAFPAIVGGPGVYRA